MYIRVFKQRWNTYFHWYSLIITSLIALWSLATKTDNKSSVLKLLASGMHERRAVISCSLKVFIRKRLEAREGFLCRKHEHADTSTIYFRRATANENATFKLKLALLLASLCGLIGFRAPTYV